MAEGYTAFVTYMLTSNNEISGNNQGNGYSDAIHCNYIRKITMDDKKNKEINFYFNDDDIGYFKFLSTSGGSGFTAHRVIMLMQLINNDPYESISNVRPHSDKWVTFDVTNQITDYVSDQILSPSGICNTVFKLPVKEYIVKASNNDFYDLNYLSYPKKESDDLLCFGDETYFMGNVKATVEAIAYTMDLNIKLPLNQFNTTNNTTWNSDLDNEVYISEVGIYDDNKNLVGIAKLNNPIKKDETIARTLVFAMDF